jgi:hypothetical protein
MKRNHLLLVLIALAATFLASVPAALAATPDGTFTVVSLAYEDQNLDGTYDLSASGMEAAAASVTIRLYADHAPYNILGPEDELVETQITNDEGYAVFQAVQAGFYLLNVVPPDGYIATAPATQAVVLDGDAMGTAVEWMFGLTAHSRLPNRTFLPTITH